MSHKDDLYDYVMQHNPEQLDPAYWTEEEREALHARELRFIRDLDAQLPPTRKPDLIIKFTVDENGKRRVTFSKPVDPAHE